MKYLIYVSTAVKMMEDAELFALLFEGKEKNTGLGITGMLVYSEGLFIEVLEGSDEVLDRAFTAIEADSYHKNVIKLTDSVLTQRNFKNWSMAFVPAKPSLLQHLDGYINPNSQGFLLTDSQHPAITILRTFIDNNRFSV